jgi:hypothetical protein
MSESLAGYDITADPITGDYTFGQPYDSGGSTYAHRGTKLGIRLGDASFHTGFNNASGSVHIGSKANESESERSYSARVYKYANFTGPPSSFRAGKGWGQVDTASADIAIAEQEARQSEQSDQDEEESADSDGDFLASIRERLHQGRDKGGGVASGGRGLEEHDARVVGSDYVYYGF